MAGKQIDNLSIVVSANTGPLAQDLKKAARDIEQFSKTTARPRGDDGLPVLRQRRLGGVLPDRAGQTFAAFNRAKADAAAVARQDKVLMDTAAAARDNRQAREAAALRAGFQSRRDTPAFVRSLTEYGQPGALSRSASAVGGVARSVAGFAGNGLAAGFGRVRDAAGEATSSVMGFAKAIPPIAVGVAAAEVGLGGLSMAFGHLKDSVTKATDFESTLLGFEVLLRSADDARTLVADIRRFAATTPFNNRELADAGRQLLAYGFTAEKVMPTIKMLGDVSAAMPDRLPIGDAAYLYGTLRSQGRAYARDILQFSQRGISINEELAAVLGKSTHEIASLVEEGRVGFRDVEMAFQRMTSEGGRFYGMTARQGQTTRAAFEQLGDAVDMLKISFGQVLIEELDLKGGARDLQAFAGRIRDATSEIRPAVRFVGDLARAGAQLGYEFTRAGAAVASINLTALDRTFPGIGRAADSFHQLIKDAKDFKFDEERLIDFGADMATTFVRSLAVMEDGIKGVGQKIKAEMIDPLVAAADKIDRMIPTMPRAPQQRPGERPPAAFGVINPSREDIVRMGQPPGRREGDPIRAFDIAPPRPGMTADRIKAEWSELNNLVRYLESEVARLRPLAAGADPQRSPIPDHVRRLEQQLQDAHRSRFGFQSGFVGDPIETQRHLDAGRIPAIRGGWGDPGDAPQPSVFERVNRTIDGLREDLRAGARQRREAREQGEFRELARFAGLGPIAALPPAVQDARALAVSQNRAAAWAGGVGGPLAAVAGVPDRTPEPRPEAMQLGIELRRAFDPRQELTDYRRDLDAVRLHRLAGPDSGPIADRAWRQKVQEVAGRFGLGQPQQLPSAVEAGSAEDARLINTWRTQQTNTTDQLLMQLIQAAQKQIEAIERLPDFIRIPIMRLPGD